MYSRADGAAHRLAAGSYAASTTPLLEETQQEVASGAVKKICYADPVRLISWSDTATEHGGLAEVEVTRTAYVTRASGPEPPQLATYRFRVHRHVGPHWLAVDFFRPDVSRWVTDLAGATVVFQMSAMADKPTCPAGGRHARGGTGSEMTPRSDYFLWPQEVRRG